MMVVSAFTKVLSRGSAIRGFVIAGLYFSLSHSTLAQVVVRDSAPIKPSTPAVAAQESAASRNFTYQLELLQQEILELRGIIEEQAYDIKRLKQQRLDDYLDLDKRVSQLTRNAAPTAPAVIDNLPIDTRVPGSAAVAVDNGTEKAVYDQAMSQLLDKQDYKAAQQGYVQYLNQYPNGRYVPNIYYWQGQILLTQGNEKGAAKKFKRLIAEYPNNSKSADGKFKLARIYFSQGKRKESKALLDQVAKSNTDAAPLAKSFLSKNF